MREKFKHAEEFADFCRKIGGEVEYRKETVRCYLVGEPIRYSRARLESRCGGRGNLTVEVYKEGRLGPRLEITDESRQVELISRGSEVHESKTLDSSGFQAEVITTVKEIELEEDEDRVKLYINP